MVLSTPSPATSASSSVRVPIRPSISVTITEFLLLRITM
jgi:hypothetical protein